MVGLINLIPAALLIIGCYLAYKGKSLKSRLAISILTLSSLVVYFQLQPSYGVKGEIKRTMVPSFEQKEIQINDLQPKPMSGEERDLRRMEKYKEGLPFVDKE